MARVATALKTQKFQIYQSLSLLTYQNTLSLSLSLTPKHTNPKPSLHQRQKTLLSGDLLVSSLSLSPHSIAV